jgi:hypothetical protein
MQPVVEGFDLDEPIDQSAEAGGEGGDPDLPVCGVRNDDDVRAKLVLVYFE